MVSSGTSEVINQRPVGTGHFVLHAYQQDAQIRYAANKDYWNGAPKIERLILAITPEPLVHVTRIKVNEWEVAAPPRGCRSYRTEVPPDVDILSQPGQNIGAVGFSSARSRTQRSTNIPKVPRSCILASSQCRPSPAFGCRRLLRS